MLQEITPQLERLRKEKEIYLRFKENEKEATVLWKKLVAAEFMQCARKKTDLMSNVQSLRT